MRGTIAIRYSMGESILRPHERLYGEREPQWSQSQWDCDEYQVYAWSLYWAIIQLRHSLNLSLNLLGCNRKPLLWELKPSAKFKRQLKRELWLRLVSRNWIVPSPAFERESHHGTGLSPDTPVHIGSALSWPNAIPLKCIMLRRARGQSQYEYDISHVI